MLQYLAFSSINVEIIFRTQVLVKKCIVYLNTSFSTETSITWKLSVNHDLLFVTENMNIF